jgi:5-methylcytosine-specific restriction endonuclease McrA
MPQDYTAAAPVAQERRPWTQDNQDTAEMLRAEGWSYAQIGRSIGFAAKVVDYRLNIEKYKERAQRWSEKNQARRREARQHWREENREQINEYHRRWRHENPEKVKAYQEVDKNWVLSNPEKVKANQQRYREKHSEKRNAYTRLWRKANPEKSKNSILRWRESNQEKVLMTTRRRYALRRSGRKAALVRINQALQAKRFALFGDACAYCGFSEKLTLDHVLALTTGGLDEPDNIAPACRSCNSRKNNRPVEVWYRSQPFFCEVRWELIKQHCPGATGQLSLAMPA